MSQSEEQPDANQAPFCGMTELDHAGTLREDSLVHEGRKLMSVETGVS
jgi:hypothetical protein